MKRRMQNWSAEWREKCKEANRSGEEAKERIGVKGTIREAAGDPRKGRVILAGDIEFIKQRRELGIHSE